MPSLFDPIQLGAIQAPNRILMAPMTRSRATTEGVPTGLMVDYYAQRASAGLIITEGTGISREGLGWPFARGCGPMSRSRHGSRSPARSMPRAAISSSSSGIWAVRFIHQ